MFSNFLVMLVFLEMGLCLSSTVVSKAGHCVLVEGFNREELLHVPVSWHSCSYMWVWCQPFSVAWHCWLVFSLQLTVIHRCFSAQSLVSQLLLHHVSVWLVITSLVLSSCILPISDQFYQPPKLFFFRTLAALLSSVLPSDVTVFIDFLHY